MLASLLAAALIASTGPATIGADPGQARAPSPAAELSPGQLAGQRVITGFAGTEPTADLRRMIRTGKVAGVILFGANVGGDPATLTASLQAIPRPKPLAELPLLVMVDQEGGLVKRLPGPPTLSAAQMGAAGATEARRQGRATGRYLSELGINVDLAPVLDVGRTGGEIESTDRSFGTSARRVARVGGAFADGLAARGALPTAKHFPGLGAAFANTDSVTQTIGLSKRRLRATDERPFRAFASAPGGEDHKRLVMMSSAVYPALDRRLPAGLSRRVATVELRDKAGFAGVSITDAMSSAAITAVGDTARTARLAAHAGTDLLLYTSTGQAGAGQDALRRALRGGAIKGGWFKASVRRVLALRDSLKAEGI